jgi:hypothetical protein
MARPHLKKKKKKERKKQREGGRREERIETKLFHKKSTRPR